MERRVTKLEEQNLGVIVERLANLSSEVREQGRTITWVLRTLVALAATVVGGAILYAITSGGV